MLTQTMWHSAFWLQTRSTNVTSLSKSTLPSFKRSASITTSTWCGLTTSSVWLTSWAQTKLANLRTHTAFLSRALVQTRGKTLLWTNCICSVKRAGVCMTGFPPSPSQSAEQQHHLNASFDDDNEDDEDNIITTSGFEACLLEYMAVAVAQEPECSVVGGAVLDNPVGGVRAYIWTGSGVCELDPCHIMNAQTRMMS
ncbi:hypothetical protein DPEC_G00259790 [Dallia pectoralis]|uniref:Uncharacterized protein n=1 Tax=Dallia pectoralis TaxID=75939 RepID=A0ACC2FRS3_DALPE|nr:hypothetical protein DPEC_G00259790 [Dallia pectoralis]